MLTRDLSVTIVGTTGVGKTTLVKRIEGGDLETTTTIDIEVTTKKIKLLSQESRSSFSLEKYRTYKVTTVDCPGDISRYPRWFSALKKYRTQGIIFMIDPTQDFRVQNDALIQTSNYLLMTLDKDVQEAERKALKAKVVIFLLVNKLDLLDYNQQKADRVIAENFSETWDGLKRRFPAGGHFWEAISAIDPSTESYEKIDGIFETIRWYFYEK